MAVRMTSMSGASESPIKAEIKTLNKFFGICTGCAERRFPFEVGLMSVTDNVARWIHVKYGHLN